MLRLRDLYLTNPPAVEDFGKLDFLPSAVPAENSIIYILIAFADLELIQKLDLHVDSLIRLDAVMSFDWSTQ